MGDFDYLVHDLENNCYRSEISSLGLDRTFLIYLALNLQSTEGNISWRQREGGSTHSLKRLAHPPKEGVMTYLQKALFNAP